MRVELRLSRDGSGAASAVVTDALGAPLSQPRPFSVVTTSGGWQVARPATPPAAGAPHAGLCGGDLAPLDQLMAAAKDRTIDDAGILRYGRLLFDAVLGAQWGDAVAAVEGAGAAQLELAVRVGDGLGALQDLHWEAMHDGQAFISLAGPPWVSVVRVLPGPPEAPVPALLTRLPRILFAVGTDLVDRDIRPGAEFMGVLRRLERDGGAVQPKVIDRASKGAIAEAVVAFEPDIVHLIAHGRFDPVHREGQLRLRADPGEGAEPVWTSADALAPALATPRWPVAVVLSACDTATGTARAGAPGTPSFAATLVARGAPLVVAMAGEVADKACRLFSRALVAAVASAAPMSAAVAIGRRAAFEDGGAGVNSIDWALPVLYLSEQIPAGFVLVDPTEPLAVRDRITVLDLARPPVFCGRAEFFSAFDELLDPGRPLAVLGVFLTGPPEGVGSTRLLRELGARAVRAGHVPVMVGPYELTDDDRPRDRATLTLAVLGRMATICKKLGLSPPPSQARAALAGGIPPGRDELADRLREDLFAMAAETTALPATASHPKPVLLLAGVHAWDAALTEMLGVVGTTGYGSGPSKLPVVFSGANAGAVGDRLREVWENHDQSAGWKRYLPLGRWRHEEDALAYQWLLLNPATFNGAPVPPVYTLRRGAGVGWIENCRLLMENRPIFDPILYKWAEKSTKDPQWFVANDDELALQKYPELAT